MPADLCAGYTQTGTGSKPDAVRDANAVTLVASHAKSAADARLLLDALGLTDAAPLAATLLKLGRRVRPA